MCEEGLVGVGGKEGGKRKRRMGGSSQEQSCEKSPHTAKKKSRGWADVTSFGSGLGIPPLAQSPNFLQAFYKFAFQRRQVCPPLSIHIKCLHTAEQRAGSFSSLFSQSVLSSVDRSFPEKGHWSQRASGKTV